MSRDIIPLHEPLFADANASCPGSCRIVQSRSMVFSTCAVFVKIRDSVMRPGRVVNVCKMSLSRNPPASWTLCG